MHYCSTSQIQQIILHSITYGKEKFHSMVPINIQVEHKKMTKGAQVTLSENRLSAL